MAINDACDNDRRDGNTVGDFPEERGRGAESWGGNSGAGVAVGDDGDEEVHGCVDALEEEEGLGVLGGGVELGDE